MSCTGAIETLNAGGTGEIVRLSCCPQPAAQEQELVRRWKQVRLDMFSTAPIPFGVASFSTGFGTWISGPPKPGEDATSTAPPLAVDPAVTSGSSRANPGQSAHIANIIPD